MRRGGYKRILKPLDLMSPYRLEMGTKLETSEGKDLYEFWGQEITNSINESISTHKSKYILNLASVEYFSSVKKDLLNGEVISPVFKDYKNGKYKIISFFADRTAGPASMSFSHFLCLIPTELSEGTCEDDGFSFKDFAFLSSNGFKLHT